MVKRGIYNENTFRGRFKGNTDGRVTNPTIQKNWDEVAWGSDNYWWCKECGRYVDSSKSCKICGRTDGK